MNFLRKLKSKISKEEFIFILLILAIAIPSILIFYKDKKIVLENHLPTTGRIINYSIVGDADTPYLEYEYYKNEARYTRTITPLRTMDSCFNNISLCNQVYYLVIYSPEHPSKSLIDLSDQIPYTTTPKTPIELKNFE
ncbi:MAG: hypothetical protein H0X62_07710 [Bacteroidetes bacterium]|nr:hypothetical protein [Bacteroidota bacterium]